MFGIRELFWSLSKTVAGMHVRSAGFVFAAIFTTIFLDPNRGAATPPGTNIMGTVSNVSGKPIPGVEIRALDKATARVVGRAISDKNGNYAICNVPTGAYVMKLDPLQTAFKGADAVGYSAPKGLTVDWHLALKSDSFGDAVMGAAGTAGVSASLAQACGALLQRPAAVAPT